MKQITLLIFSFLTTCLSYGQVVINEVDSDQTGTDSMEFVELFSETPNQSLDGLVLVLFNGSSDTSYNSVDLNGFTTDENGYFLIGGNDVATADITLGATNILQNGADAIAIYTGNVADYPTGTAVSTTNLLDALVYGTSDGDDAGLLDGLGETTQYDENENSLKDSQSLQLVDGVFCASTPTPRATNVCAVATSTEVATIAELRAGTVGESYTLTGEALLTYQQDFRGQKYIEDNTAAILIDDNSGVITTTYTIGDGITGITGVLGSFDGALQFVPSEDSGAATSTGNTITAQVVTADMLNANPADYESEYVQLTSTTVDNTNSTTWDNGVEYPLTTANGGYIFRAAFFNVDYIGTTVPGTADISGIITKDNSISYITARNAADINVLSAGCPLSLETAIFECTSETTGTDGTTISIPFSGGANGVTYTLGTSAGTVDGDNPSSVETGTIIITGVDEGTTITFTVVSDSCDLSQDLTTPACEPLPEAANIAELRAYDLGTEVILTGEAVLTFQRSSRNQKYIEDATAAILIDDSAETITTTYNLGDGITGITGTLGEFRGVLQFVPSEDPGTATSTENAIVAQVVTLAELTANGEDYESEYVEVMEATIDNGGSTDWAAGQNYTITAGGDTFILRTNFGGADYIGTTIPTVATNISGVLGEFNGTYQLQPRFLADFEEFMSVGENNALVVSIYPNPATSFINVTTSTPGEKSVAIYEISGKKVIDTVTAQPISVANLSAGIYLVKVSEANRSMTSKLIIK
ncbi:DUF5689 domain-containing protein [Dokdonia sp. Hel_I_53]|uniref:DUF5689 domain-containing protein n=1 Tax=Dokdonia sp. Hel_I_53 TaxID=1566287 RepID=UPI0011A79677|nr:DUF5689 domain-containing protein [Dokdonia sp. Hel_I_53]